MDKVALRKEFQQRYPSFRAEGAFDLVEVIDAHILRAYRFTARRARLRIHVLTRDINYTAGDSTENLGATVADSIDIASAGVKGVYDITNDNKLEPVHSVRHRMQFSGETDDEDPGQPDAYEITGYTLRLIPTPETALTVRLYYYRSDFNLADDADVPLLPSSYHHILVPLAMSYAARDDKDTERAAAWLSEYESGYAAMLGEVGDEPTELYPEIEDALLY
jgi:hypothetical protein